jgi:hypothetical protein
MKYYIGIKENLPKIKLLNGVFKILAIQFNLLTISNENLVTINQENLSPI